MPSGGMGELLLYLEVLYHISDLLVRRSSYRFPHGSFVFYFVVDVTAVTTVDNVLDR